MIGIAYPSITLGFNFHLITYNIQAKSIIITKNPEKTLTYSENDFTNAPLHLDPIGG